MTIPSTQPKASYIEDGKVYWGEEFALMLDTEYREEYDEIAAMGAYTLLYDLAWKFKDGEFAEEILSLYLDIPPL